MHEVKNSFFDMETIKRPNPVLKNHQFTEEGQQPVDFLTEIANCPTLQIITFGYTLVKQI
jgi:hypothetical protein